MNNRTRIIVIALIMAIVASLFFLVADITPLFITAYVFALAGIFILCLGNLYLLDNIKRYPWIAAFPLTIWRYLCLQLALSAVFVICENAADWPLDTKWFILIHCALLAGYIIILIAMQGGGEIIERVDDTAKAARLPLRSLQADVTAIAARVPEHTKTITTVADALRYSTAKSYPAVSELEDEIKQNIAVLEKAADNGNTGEIPGICGKLLALIKERNDRVKEK